MINIQFKTENLEIYSSYKIKKLEPRQRRPTECFNEIMANLRLRGHVTPKFIFSKVVILYIVKLCVALSLTVAKIMSNLHFRGHLTLKGHVTPKSIF